MPEKMTEAAISLMLADKYSGKDWGFLTQVPNGTGLAKNRTADALAMSLWPSKGLHLHGFEIKVNRADWLKEIQDMSKSAAFLRYCHYWWVVAPPDVVKLEEMPADWGLIIAGSSLRNKKAATLRNPDPVGHDLLAGIIRSTEKVARSRDELEEARDIGYRNGYANGKKEGERHASTDGLIAIKELTKLKQDIADFERASGMRINGWNGGNLGAAVELVQRLNYKQLGTSISSLESALNAIKTAHKEYETKKFSEPNDA